jgi:hypothetical protein
MSLASRCAAALMIPALAACASAASPANDARFERNVGIATASDAYAGAMKVIRQYQFEIERETQETQLYIETRWRPRNPFPDEQALGIGAAQIRMMVRANPRSGTSLGELYNVNIAVESRVQVRGSTDWTETVATREYRAYAQQITEDLKRELDLGVRRYGDPATGS